MGKDTSIQWCHSTLNLQMGCEGCELWSKTVKKCYAGRKTQGMAGAKGWPKSFEEPALFLDRLDDALRWGDPTDRERDLKPWIPRDMPRLIFLNDMGDTFSSKLSEDWLAPLLPRMAASRHQFLLLTKRPSKMVAFSERHRFPENVWPGTTVTGHKTANRADLLDKVQGGGPRFVSFEPLWTPVPKETFTHCQWAIFGGESGDKTTATQIFDLRMLAQSMIHAKLAGADVFVKQLGSRPYYDNNDPADAQKINWDEANDFEREQYATALAEYMDKVGILELKDGHGGDWDEWPEVFRVRRFPDVKLATQGSLL